MSNAVNIVFSRKAAKRAVEETGKLVSDITGTEDLVEEQRRNRELAERQLATEREALAALQAGPEPALPTADDEATKRARRRSIAAQLRRRGRASTILTDSGASDALGT